MTVHKSRPFTIQSFPIKSDLYLVFSLSNNCGTEKCPPPPPAGVGEAWSVPVFLLSCFPLLSLSPKLGQLASLSSLAMSWSLSFTPFHCNGCSLTISAVPISCFCHFVGYGCLFEEGKRCSGLVEITGRDLGLLLTSPIPTASLAEESLFSALSPTHLWAAPPY